jgi:ribose transport system permease protein
MEATTKTRPETSRTQATTGVPRFSVSRVLSSYGLVLILLALVLLFSLLLPETFPTVTNARALLNDKANIALLALAVMIPLAAAQYDLSIGYVLGFSHVLAIGLQTKQGLSWEVAVLITVAAGLLIGAANGALVAFAKIDSFIATLGAGTVILGVTYWYTGGQQIFGSLPQAFTDISQAQPLGIPLPALIVLAVAVVLWIMFEYLPIGRYLYALGANARAAELVGIPSRRFVLGAFMASGGIAALDGVLLASKLQIGTPGVGPDLLLPAFVGALLGATAIRPGRVNAIGTLLAVGVLAVGISGLEQAGASYFVEPLFNGSLLIVGVGVMLYGERRRAREAENIAVARMRQPAAPGPDSPPAR